METSSDKKELTFGMVARNVQLSKLQLRTIFMAVLNLPEVVDDAPIPNEPLFFILLADMLEQLTFLTAEQRLLIVQGLYETRHVNDDACCLNQLIFADNQHCTWTGHTGWVDLESGEDVESLPYPPVETIAYNLNERCRRVRLKIEKRSGLHAKHNAGSVDEQGNVRVSSLDAIFGSVRDRGPAVGPDHDHAGD
jgi:hypothetical protein